MNTLFVSLSSIRKIFLVIFGFGILTQNPSIIAQQTVCCLSPVSTTATPSDIVPGLVAISPSGCLTVGLVQQPPSTLIATYAINPANCTLGAANINGLDGTEFPVALTYTPSGCLTVAGFKDPLQGSEIIPATVNSSCVVNFNYFTTNMAVLSSLAATDSCIVVADCTGTQTIPWRTPITHCVQGNLGPSNLPGLNQVTFSPDGSCLAAIDCTTPNPNVNTYSVVNCTTFNLVSSISVPGANSLVFSPDGGCLVVTSTTNTVTSFSVSDCGLTLQSQVSTGNGTGPVQASFSPDGTCVAVANAGNTVAGGTLDIYSVSSTCGLSLVNQIIPSATETGRGVAWTPVSVGNCLYFVTNANIYSYAFTATPVLTSAVAACPQGLIQVSGTAAVDASLTMLANGTTVIGSTTASSAGSFSVTTSVPLAPGTYTITVVDTSSNCVSNGVSVSILPPNVTISKTVKQCKDIAFFTIVVTNKGSCAVNNITVTDTLPRGLSLLEICAPGWSVTRNDQSFSAVLGQLGAGQVGPVIQVKAKVCCQSGKVVNTAKVTAGGKTNSASATVKCKKHCE